MITYFTRPYSIPSARLLASPTPKTRLAPRLDNRHVRIVFQFIACTSKDCTSIRRAPRPAARLSRRSSTRSLATLRENELRFAFLSVWKAFRNGTFYGTKIRLPHSIVMTLLFNRSTDVRYMLDRMTGLTWEHSRNLALFAGFYKLCLAIARLIRVKLGDKLAAPMGKPTTQLDSFLAAALVGHFVWGRYSSVNSQIVLYLLSRITIALPKVAAQKGYPIFRDYDFDTVYPYLASGVWGTVLWLYEFYPETLQKSLTGSMDFLYDESNRWEGGTTDFLPSPATAAVFVYVTLRAREKLQGK